MIPTGTPVYVRRSEAPEAPRGSGQNAEQEKTERS
jgi:hypothetical protein